MSRVGIDRRAILVTELVAAAAFACSKPAVVEDDDREPAPEAPHGQDRESQAVQVDACHALAQLYCNNGPVECEQMESMLRETGVPEPACGKAVQELEAMLASIGEAERAILPMVLARYLPTVLLESPTLTAEQRAKLEAMASGDPPPAMDVPADFDIDRLDVRCPGVAEAKGEMPPAGFERWCERADGRRHGPSHLWNSSGEWVREVEYRDGQPVQVSFRMPDSQQLNPEAFMCPVGLIERREGSGQNQRRRCETETGVVSGPHVEWEGGRVVVIASYENGQAVQVSVKN